MRRFGVKQEEAGCCQPCRRCSPPPLPLPPLRLLLLLLLRLLLRLLHLFPPPLQTRPSPLVVPQVTMADFLEALVEVKPAFGATLDSLEGYRLHGMIDYGPRYQHLLSSCRTLVQQVRRGARRGSVARGRQRPPLPAVKLLHTGAAGAAGVEKVAGHDVVRAWHLQSCRAASVAWPHSCLHAPFLLAASPYRRPC